MELTIVDKINNFGAGTWVDNFSLISSEIVIMIFMWFCIGVGISIMEKKNGKWFLFAIIIVVIIHLLINDLIIKYCLLTFFPIRERPYIAYPEVVNLIGYPFADSSFPSGHMSSATGITTVFILYYSRKYWVWLIGGIYILLMAFTRIHNGVHYPSDVFGGIVLGIGYGFLAFYLVKLIRIKYQKKATA